MGNLDNEPSLRQDAGNSALAKLAKSVCDYYAVDVEKWLDMAITPLPETVRLNPLRHDLEWTIRQLELMGAKPLEWFKGTGINCNSKKNRGTKTRKSDGARYGAWQFPWSRGKAPDDEKKKLLQALHETGRVTRQEAASMLPVLIMNPRPSEKILDLCAAPGSKTTQAAEAMQGKGVVLANEKNPGRSNLLSTNRNRVGVANISICCHDARHFPKVPLPGFDAILADVPCTGTATTRKNKALWWNWNQQAGLGMHKLQVDILSRGAKLLRPSGRIVYSTCSIDPMENEKVIAKVLQELPWLKLQNISEECHPSIELDQGMKEWEGSEKIPKHILQQLTKCKRLPLGKYDTGGFFVALLTHEGEGEVAEALITDPDWIPTYRKLPIPSKHTPVPLESGKRDEMIGDWGVDDEGFAWFSRGKSVSITTRETLDWLHTPERPAGNKKIWPGGHWHPVKILHAGIPAFEKRNDKWRPKGTVMQILRGNIDGPFVKLNSLEMHTLLQGEPVEIRNLEYTEGAKGPILAGWSDGDSVNDDEYEDRLSFSVGAWIGERLTSMTNEFESYIRQIQLNYTPISNSEKFEEE